MAELMIYDTTLRDGNQARGISLSLEDKLRIARKLDETGLHYIEGGWPNPTSPTDVQFFERIRAEKLKNSRLAAFGSTCRPKVAPQDDPILAALVSAKTPVITIFGKSWDLHATEVIKTTLDENLRMIRDSVRYLKDRCEEVVYDAEHFFDGYKNNPEYALKTLMAAQEGGAASIVLCDTNGGCLPMDFSDIYDAVAAKIQTPLGVHTHNDSGCAVANSLIAASKGTCMIQGVINGFGERCGNANLCTIIPNLKLKMGRNVLSDANLQKMVELSVFVSEIANVVHDERQPYVGEAAFSHKGGAHIDGVMKVTHSFEHINPETVGNSRQYILSDQSGGSTIVEKLKKYRPDVSKKDPEVARLLTRVKEMEHKGYQFEAAEGSFDLLMRKELKLFAEPFRFIGFRVIEELLSDGTLYSEATIKVEANGQVEHTAAEGNGPVSALDHAMRKALCKFFPELSSVHLVDYKVRVLAGMDGTDAKVRVLITSTDNEEYWGTIGVSENIIEASWIALIDSLSFKLAKEAKRKIK
ncbi:MAG: citramalate synthase [Elusimicrobia bacterium RIFOXYB2_FULL_49_7]|nr:MAG: citramalate synthase [Elusimicrobia bacterium RIFOXYB2_FULL_49_7]